MPDLSCRDLVEALWWFWNKGGQKALIDGKDVDAWAAQPRDRDGLPWPGGARNCDTGASDDGNHILEASHCGQRSRPRPPSADAPVVAPPPIDINTYQPRRWFIRYKLNPSKAAHVYFSLSEAECRRAWAKAQDEVSDLGLQLVEHETAGWIARSYGDKKCAPCRGD